MNEECLYKIDDNGFVLHLSITVEEGLGLDGRERKASVTDPA